MKHCALLLAVILCSIGTVFAGSSDGTFDLKTFGASGSTRTMRCSVAAGSSTLSNCSGGDFAVGQTIRLPSVGALPTITPPGTPSVACKVGNHASCTGSTTYSYELAAIQGRPNGAITAVGGVGTITQATQSPRAASGQYTPYVFTSLKWPAVPGAQLLILYKSINGGPRNLYAVIPGNYTSLDDYGVGWSQQSFTCSDLNVPCTAPSVPTPNDVFAQITTIGGSNYTIAADPYPPKYTLQGELPAKTYPSRPSVTSPRVTIYHDDTPAFQSIEHYLYTQSRIDPGHVTIFMPPGNYNVYAADQYGGARAFTFVGMNDVTLEGAGWGTKIHQIGDRTNGLFGMFIFSEAGYDNLNAPGIHSGARGGKVGAAHHSLTRPPLALRR